MSKTVKHCTVCQEDFGDRFSFCPVCGESLTTIAENQPEPVVQASSSAHNHQFVKAQPVAAATAPLDADAIKESPRAETAAQTTRETKVVEARSQQTETATVRPLPAGDGLYHLTILETPNSYNRYFTMGAVLGLFILMTGMVGIYLYDIFNYNLDVAAVQDEMVLSSAILNEEPPMVEEPEPKPKDNKDAGGGGGGGKNDPKPPSRGGDAAQTPDPPIFPPSSKIPQRDNPELPITTTTQGPPRKADPGVKGIKSSLSDDLSDGGGTGGGIGTGTGQGQGSGIGTGIGSGIGSGRGSGVGSGVGSGRGAGVQGDPPPAAAVRPPAPAVTEALKIISNPKPGYTDEARKNNISGTVKLRVMFSASGQVTDVSVISGLPNGLTEKAIAAARQITFTPAKKNGQPYSISRAMEYNFKIY